MDHHHGGIDFSFEFKTLNYQDTEQRKKKLRRKPEFRRKYDEFKLGSMVSILPIEITFDIFSRLPTDSVFQCKQVCKTWKNLLNLPSFADTCLKLRKDELQNVYINGGSPDYVGLGLLFSIRFTEKDKDNVCLYYGDYDDDDQFSYNTLRKFNHPPINKRNDTYAMVGSCNGLVCFAVPHLYYDPVYILNPITREYTKLQTFEISNDQGHMVSGFGYHLSSNTYKVVRIYYYCNKPFGEVQVYTIGDNSGWRNKGKITWSLIGKRRNRALSGILVNGALHWLDYKSGEIVAFDLADEEFRVVSSPPCFLPAAEILALDLADKEFLVFSSPFCFIPAGYKNRDKHCFQLRELGGYLCLVQQVRGERVDIWSLKKAKNNTTYNVKEQNYQSWTWSREFSIRWEGQETNEYDPFAITKKGEVLFWFNYTNLCRYDPKTDSSKWLVEDEDKGLKFFEAIPHINSFVSLKALGQKCTKRKSYMCRDNRISPSNRAKKL